MNLKLNILSAAVGLLTVFPSLGFVFYEADTHTLVVSDFPEAMPARLETLARADRANGWNMISCDLEKGIWTIRANLQVGRNDGSETWMQIGCAAHTDTTLLLDGTLIVAPYFAVGKNDRYTPPRMNRLTLGDPSNSAIRTALKITAGHTIYSGKLIDPDGKLRNGRGGELHVYHGTLTSASGQRDLARPYWSGLLMLDHAVVSGFKSQALFGSIRGRSNIRNSIFENNRGVFGSLDHRVVNCLFRNNTTVIEGLRGQTVQLINCRFDDNILNWKFSGGIIECVDCIVNAGSEPDVYGFNADHPGRIIARRHVVVKVVGDADLPIAGAKVVVSAKSDEEDLIFNNAIETGPDGCTAGNDNPRALLLTEFIAEVAKTNEPETTRFSYVIEASTKNGMTGRIEGFAPRQSWEIVLLRVK